MRSRRATALSIANAALIVALAPAIASAQNRFGLRVGVSTNPSSAVVGAEMLLPMEHHLAFDPNVELAFGDNANTAEISGDVLYHLAAASYSNVWIGGGPAILVRNFDRGPGDDRSRTDFGVNLLLGGAFPTRQGMLPYVQAKLVLSNNTHGVIAVGLRF